MLLCRSQEETPSWAIAYGHEFWRHEPTELSLACGLGLDTNPTVYTSPDGEIWRLRDPTVTASLRAAITIKDAIYITGDSVIKKSTDGGTTWTDTYTNSGGNKLFMGLASNGEYLIVAGFGDNVWVMPTVGAPLNSPR